MKLVFLGPPGAGKGTQSARLIEKLSIPQLSTGDTIRAAIRDKTELGQQAESFANNGKLVPDDLVNRLVEERLAQPDCELGFLLDGFPRTLPQAEALETMLERLGQQLDHVLLLDVPEETLLHRITGRRTDPESGAVYHLEFDPPPPEITDRLIQRKDDTEEVFAERLRAYSAQTAPLIPFYESRGLLRRIDGVGSMEEITDRVFQILC